MPYSSSDHSSLLIITTERSGSGRNSNIKCRIPYFNAVKYDVLNISGQAVIVEQLSPNIPSLTFHIKTKKLGLSKITFNMWYYRRGMISADFLASYSIFISLCETGNDSSITVILSSYILIDSHGFRSTCLTFAIKES